MNKGNLRVDTPNGGYAEVVKHSTSESGKELITYNLKYGLIVHAEFLRHKLFNFSVKSNRAVPCSKIRKEVWEDPYVPIHFGSNERGMVANVPHSYQNLVRGLWRAARYPAMGVHWVLDKCGLHKEVANRLLNPWQWVRKTMTATELDNFFNLRIHSAAQKDIYVIAEAMLNAKNQSTPTFLQPGEWHVPYVNTGKVGGKLYYYDNDGAVLSANEAIKCSAARCARSSYDNHDGTKSSYNGPCVGRTDKELYNSLIEDDPKHASPAEHQGTPMKEVCMESLTHPNDWENGVSHMGKDGKYWSGNFVGFVQHRQLLSDHTCWEYKEDNNS